MKISKIRIEIDGIQWLYSHQQNFKWYHRINSELNKAGRLKLYISIIKVHVTRLLVGILRGKRYGLIPPTAFFTNVKTLRLSSNKIISLLELYKLQNWCSLQCFLGSVRSIKFPLIGSTVELLYGHQMGECTTHLRGLESYFVYLWDQVAWTVRKALYCGP